MSAHRTSAPPLDLSTRRALEVLQDDLGLAARDFLVIFEADKRSLASWMAGTTHPQHWRRNRLAELIQLHASILEDLGDAAAARAWLNAPSRYLGGMKPISAIRDGQLDLARNALEAIASGIHL